MRSFRFRLESLRRLRRHALDRSVAHLGNARAERATRDAEAKGSHRELGAAGARVDAVLRRGVGADRLANRLQALEAQRRQAVQAEENRRAAEAREEAARAEAAQAHARLESLERLRSRRAEAWRAAQEREAQREIDELALQRHRRGSR